MSINTQIVCGPDMKILDLVYRWPGSTHDSCIFHNSQIKSVIESGVYTGHLIGNSGYVQTKYLYTPKLSPQNPADNKYNKAHIKTRNIILMEQMEFLKVDFNVYVGSYVQTYIHEH